MTYETLAKFAQQGGSIYFAVVFIVAVIYALWPKNQKQFNEMANLPLDEAIDDVPLVKEQSELEK